MLVYNMMKIYMFLVIAFLHTEMVIVDADKRASNGVNKVLTKFKTENYDRILETFIHNKQRS